MRLNHARATANFGSSMDNMSLLLVYIVPPHLAATGSGAADTSGDGAADTTGAGAADTTGAGSADTSKASGSPSQADVLDVD